MKATSHWALPWTIEDFHKHDIIIRDGQGNGVCTMPKADRPKAEHIIEAVNRHA